MEYNAKYWKDYSEFISFVENKTGNSPSSLISDYKVGIPQINESNQLSKSGDTPEEHSIKLTWRIYEIPITRSQIQAILDSDSLKENLLFIEFTNDIKEIDAKIKKYLLNSKDENWWKDPKFKPFPLK